MKHAADLSDRNRGPLGLSLLAHALLIVSLVYLNGRTSPLDASSLGSSVQVRSVTETELRAQTERARDPQRELEKALSQTAAAKQIVQGDINLKTERAPDQAADKAFLSGHNQVVDHNTRAARVGKFKNVLKEGVQTSAAAAAEAPALKNLLTLTPTAPDTEQARRLESKTGRLKDTRIAHDRRPAAVPFAPPATAGSGKTGDGLSATDDYLEDVAIGVNTLLNTKEFKFYSFYERIRMQLSEAWQNRLSHELDTIYARGENLGYDRKTKVEVLLDERGQLQKVLIVNASGITELDRAATEAFKVAAPFPNPPQGMIDPSRKQVSIRWDFIVLADSGSTIKMEVRRSPAGF